MKTSAGSEAYEDTGYHDSLDEDTLKPSQAIRRIKSARFFKLIIVLMGVGMIISVIKTILVTIVPGHDGTGVPIFSIINAAVNKSFGIIFTNPLSLVVVSLSIVVMIIAIVFAIASLRMGINEQ